MAGGSAYFVGSGRTSNVSMRSAENPGFTERNASKLRTISPALMTSTNASATCAITSALRVRCPWRLSVVLRPPSRIAPSVLLELEANAGNTPKSIPASTHTPAVNARVAPLTSILARRGMPAGPMVTSALVAA